MTEREHFQEFTFKYDGIKTIFKHDKIKMDMRDHSFRVGKKDIQKEKNRCDGRTH